MAIDAKEDEIQMPKLMEICKDVSKPYRRKQRPKHGQTYTTQRSRKIKINEKMPNGSQTNWAKIQIHLGLRVWVSLALYET